MGVSIRAHVGFENRTSVTVVQRKTHEAEVLLKGWSLTTLSITQQYISKTRADKSKGNILGIRTL